jgi:hypothetical protein
VWRESDSSLTVLLLGGGRIEQAPRGRPDTDLLWTDVDHRGMRPAAKQLGYKGGTAMTFLRLTDVVFPNGQPPMQGLAGIDTRLNIATAAQVAALQAMLAIV